MEQLWQAFGHTITNILPKSPFAAFIRNAPEWPGLGYLNWIIPMQDILNVFGAWLAALAAFYLVQIVLRWVKVIQG